MLITVGDFLARLAGKPCREVRLVDQNTTMWVFDDGVYHIELDPATPAGLRQLAKLAEEVHLGQAEDIYQHLRGWHLVSTEPQRLLPRETLPDITDIDG